MNERDNSGMFERILQHIPGFGGYLEREKRRESDQQTRDFVLGQLQVAKIEMERYARSLVDEGRIDDLPAFETLRSQLTHLTGAVSSHVQSYGGFLDSDEIDENVVEDVYDCEAELMEDVRKLIDVARAMAHSDQASALSIEDLAARLTAVRQRVDQRSELLRSLE